MSQEVIFIIGSFFGFLISISATVLNHIFQSKRDERDRGWELEDKERQKRNEIKQNRIHQAEEYANLDLITALEMFDFEMELIQATFPKEFTKYAELKVIEIKDLIKESSKKASSIYLIGNKELYERSKILHDFIRSEYKWIYDLLNRKGKADIDFESESQRLAEFMVSVKESHEEFLSELDKFSISGGKQ